MTKSRRNVKEQEHDVQSYPLKAREPWIILLHIWKNLSAIYIIIQFFIVYGSKVILNHHFQMYRLPSIVLSLLLLYKDIWFYDSSIMENITKRGRIVNGHWNSICVMLFSKNPSNNPYYYVLTSIINYLTGISSSKANAGYSLFRTGVMDFLSFNSILVILILYLKHCWDELSNMLVIEFLFDMMLLIITIFMEPTPLYLNSLINFNQLRVFTTPAENQISPFTAADVSNTGKCIFPLLLSNLTPTPSNTNISATTLLNTNTLYSNGVLSNIYSKSAEDKTNAFPVAYLLTTIEVALIETMVAFIAISTVLMSIPLNIQSLSSINMKDQPLLLLHLRRHCLFLTTGACIQVMCLVFLATFMSHRRTIIVEIKTLYALMTTDAVDGVETSSIFSLKTAMEFVIRIIDYDMHFATHYQGKIYGHDECVSDIDKSPPHSPDHETTMGHLSYNHSSEEAVTTEGGRSRSNTHSSDKASEDQKTLPYYGSFISMLCLSMISLVAYGQLIRLFIVPTDHRSLIGITAISIVGVMSALGVRKIDYVDNSSSDLHQHVSNNSIQSISSHYRSNVPIFKHDSY